MRFFEQAYETLVDYLNESKTIKQNAVIDGFNQRINESDISPTVTTRPEGFKTAILVIKIYEINNSATDTE